MTLCFLQKTISGVPERWSESMHMPYLWCSKQSINWIYRIVRGNDSPLHRSDRHLELFKFQNCRAEFTILEIRSIRRWLKNSNRETVRGGKFGEMSAWRLRAAGSGQNLFDIIFLKQRKKRMGTSTADFTTRRFVGSSNFEVGLFSQLDLWNMS